MSNLCIETIYCEFLMCCVYNSIRATGKVGWFPKYIHTESFLFALDEINKQLFIVTLRSTLKNFKYLFSKENVKLIIWVVFSLTLSFGITYFKMEEVIITWGNFGSSSDCIPLLLREMMVQDVIRHSFCPLSPVFGVGSRAAQEAARVGCSFMLCFAEFWASALSQCPYFKIFF